MRGNFVKITKGFIGSGGNIDISGDAYTSIKNNLFGLLIKCNVKDGLNLTRKSALLLNIDGEKINFDLNEEFYSIEEYSNWGENYFIEIDRFLIEKDILKLLADSTNVSFRINGEKQSIEGYLTDKNIKRFREFYHDYLQ